MSCGGEIFGQCFTRIEKYPLNLCCSHIARSPCCASFTSDATTSGPLLARSFKASTSNQSPFKSNIRYCRRRWGIARKIENQSLAKSVICVSKQFLARPVLQSKHQQPVTLQVKILSAKWIFLQEKMGDWKKKLKIKVLQRRFVFRNNILLAWSFKASTRKVCF